MRFWPLKRQFLTEDLPVSTQVETFWATLQGIGYSPRLLDRVWAADRCVQLVSQEIASMPLKFSGTYEPTWVANPDPVWYPNGIGDAVFAAAWSMYGWGDAFLYVTSRYANGFPSNWTVLNPEPMSVENDGQGGKKYRSGNTILDPARMVQISRNPRGGLRGTSALRSYASHLLGAESAGDLNRALMAEGGVPHGILKSQKTTTQEQAESIKSMWVNARARGPRGAPAVLDPDIDFQQISFSPKDLLLLEAQEFDARVIASAFGVPPFLLNLPLTGGLTYQSPEMLVEQWWRVELRPAALRISRALSANMLPRGSYVEFDSYETLKPALPELVTAWDTMLKEGVVTVDEYRAAVLGLEPLTDQAGDLEAFEPAVAGASNVQPLRPALPEEAVIRP